MGTEEINKLLETLKFYKVSEGVLEKFKASNFAVIAGPAVSGKDTLREALLAHYPNIYQRVLSSTTRAKRPGEEENKTYKFITYDKMLELAKKQRLLQIALVHNQQLSAIGFEEINKLSQDKIGLSILVVQTEQELNKLKSNIKTIFLIPPSYDELLKRLSLERQSGREELKRRLTTAKQEIKIALASPAYYCLISKTQKYTTDKAHEFLTFGKRDKSADEEAREVMQAILGKL